MIKTEAIVMQAVIYQALAGGSHLSEVLKTLGEDETPERHDLEAVQGWVNGLPTITLPG